jgi:Circularly permutated YpsA SLOG family
MTVLPKGGYRQRTRQNVIDSDGTYILYYEALKGGSRLTRNLCALERKPYVLVNARESLDIVAAERIVKLSRKAGLRCLMSPDRERAGGQKGTACAWSDRPSDRGGGGGLTGRNRWESAKPGPSGTQFACPERDAHPGRRRWANKL